MKPSCPSLYWILILFFLADVTNGQIQDSVMNYFPLHPGDEWRYVRTDWLVGVTLTRSVSDSAELNEQDYLQIVETLPGPQDTMRLWYFRVDSIGNVYHFAELDSIDTIWYNFHVDSGQTYAIELPSNAIFGPLGVHVRSRTDTVHSPLGFFTDCIRLEFVRPWATGASVRIFAPQMGVVAYYDDTSRRDAWRLSYAKIDGVEYLPGSVGTVGTPDVSFIYRLHPAYPNPFNPSTTIRYDLPHAALITLTVYDLLGREVARLADGYMEQGYYEVQWNGQESASGIYIARLAIPPTAGQKAPGYSKSIKMVLLK
jgi:hypothetical protein